MKTTKEGYENLQQLLDGGLHGYRLETGYYIQTRLDFGLTGFFPAIFGGSKKIVVTTDHDLILDVWGTLTPRKSQVANVNLYVNSETGVAFPVFGYTRALNEKSTPHELLSREKFEKLIAGGKSSFQWTDGYIGGDVSREEFNQLIEMVRDQSLAVA